MKVSIIGASGKVGRQAVQNLLHNNQNENLELILVANNTNKIEGMLLDIKSAAPLTLLSEKFSPVCPKTFATNKYADIKGSDLVVVSAGIWASPEEKEAYKKIDPSGRLVQSYMNFSLVQDIAEKIENYASDSHVLVVTNQSDMMTEAVREVLKSDRVLGMGGMIDTTRFRMLLAEQSGNSQTDLQQGNHIIGYHNSDMTFLSSSLSSDVSDEAVSKVLDETKAYGASISKLQKDFNYPSINSGASVLPGYAVSAAIGAFTGQTSPIEFSFNTTLSTEMASRYGVNQDVGISVPIMLREGSFDIVSKFPISSQEKIHLGQAQKRMYDSYNKLKTFTTNNKNNRDLGGTDISNNMTPENF